MTTIQNFAVFLHQCNDIDLILQEVKTLMQQKNLREVSFEFAGSKYTIEAPENQRIITINGKKNII
jgi:hypothetical protein